MKNFITRIVVVLMLNGPIVIFGQICPVSQLTFEDCMDILNDEVPSNPTITGSPNLTCDTFNGDAGVTVNPSGGSAGIDIAVPASIFTDLTSITMTFVYEREENDASFFSYGNFDFELNSGNLGINYSTSCGETVSVGDLAASGPGSQLVRNNNSGNGPFYTIVFDYDAVTGVGQVLVNGSLFWENDGMDNCEFDWGGTSGNGIIGDRMDGSGNGTLYDWSICGDNTVLPVELVSFEVERKDQDNLISWTTASEFDNEYFEIQHSIDAIHFEPISTVYGVGNSFTLQTYSFTHRKVMHSDSYYRLKQVDIDGQYTLSDIVHVRQAIDLMVYPTLVSNFMELNAADLAKATLLNIHGQVVKTIQKNGRHNMADLSAGSYFLFVYSNDRAVTKFKILKQ